MTETGAYISLVVLSVGIVIALIFNFKTSKDKGFTSKKKTGANSNIKTKVNGKR
jgi:hypothetical protein